MLSERRNMRKLFRRAALTAFIFGCMTCAAFAMDAEVTVLDSGATLTPNGGNAITNAEAVTVSDPTSYILSYSDDSVKAGEQYLVLMVSTNDISNGTPNYNITSSSLIYINQTASISGNVTFNTVYPSSVTDSVILLTGGNLTEPKLLAKVDAQGKMGDVTGDGDINASDAALILRYTVNLQKLDAQQLSLADVTKDGDVNASDAAKILRFVVGLDTID